MLDSISSSNKYYFDAVANVKVKYIENLSPVVSISQRNLGKNSRSTIATITGLYSYLRILFASYGLVFSPVTNKEIYISGIQKIKAFLYTLKNNNCNFKLSVFDTIVHKIPNYNTHTVLAHAKYLSFMKIENLFETYIDIDAFINIKDLDIITEKLFSLNTGYFVITLDNIEFHKINEQFKLAEFYLNGTEVFVPLLYKPKCLKSDFFIDRISPSLLSFNTKIGVCESCEGTGLTKVFCKDLIVPNKNLSINQNAIIPWNIKADLFYCTMLGLANHFNFSLDTPFKDLPENIKNILFHGTKEKIEFEYPQSMYSKKKIKSVGSFGGILLSLEDKLKKSESNIVKEDLLKFLKDVDCNICSGYRININAQSIKLMGYHIGEVLNFNLNKLLEWLQNLKNLLPLDVHYIISLIEKKVAKLESLGLYYLTLNRRISTLSGGESQRIKLVNQLFSDLTDLIYVLDEPCVGLHDYDKHKLINILKEIQAKGNTIIAVEHDSNILKYADHIIDIGPGAGYLGGEVVVSGNISDLIANNRSITGKYLSGEYKIYQNKTLNKLNQKISLLGASGYNLKNINLNIYEKAINVITGVSGSGKSTLINKTLYSAMQNYLDPKNCVYSEKYDSFHGFELFTRVIKIDQSSIGRTPKSNPAIYIGLFTKIRDFFVELPEAKENKMTASMFSFNVSGGRCEYCKGDGYHKIDMQFLQDSFVICDVCQGQRYNANTLKIKYKNKSISDVLNMSADDALEFFKEIPDLYNNIKILCDIGLGYIELGQPANSLSGGEAQRIKLAKELSTTQVGNTLYIFDEPSNGLHVDDINKLIKIFYMLCENNHTVVIIEHNLNIISIADHIVDIGPDGGDKGGNIVAEGTVNDFIEKFDTHTARSLKAFLEK